MSMTKFSGSTPPLRIPAPPPCMNPVSKSGKPREETPPCTTLFPNPESREEGKKSHSWQNPTEEKKPPQLEEPHLHEPVSKSGKPREEKRSMIQWAGGKVSPGVISQMNPGPYRPLCVGGWRVGRGQRTALCQGGVLAARWSPASLGTVR